MFQRFDSRGHGQRIAGKRPGLVDRTRRRHKIHDRLRTAVGSDGQAAANDFSEARQIRGDVVDGLRPAVGDAKPGNHFIKDQQDAVLPGQRAQLPKKVLMGHHHPHVARNRLDNDTGQFPPMLPNHAPDRGHIIIRSGEGLSRGGLGHARAVGKPQRCSPGTGFDQEMVRMAMVTPFEFQDGIPSGQATSHTDGTHHRFRARTDESNLFNGRHGVTNHSRQRHFPFGRGAVTGPVTCRVLNRPGHHRMGVSQDHGSP